MLTGDTSLGDAYLRKAGAARYLERLETNPTGFFEALSPLICDKSYLIANLATVLAEAPRGPLDEIKGHLAWDKPDRTVMALKQIGVDAVSLGNNHTMDYGPERLTETISALVEAGIAVVGAGDNLNEASKALKIASVYGDVYVMAGFEVRAKYKDVYRFYAEEGRPGVNPFANGEASQIARSISRIRAQDPQAVIIAYPHWGGAANYHWANARMFKENQSFMAAGADLVLGHGAHMLQQVLAGELGTTAFSLGNFVFNSPGGYKRNNAPPYSLICRLDLKRADSRWAGTLRLYPIVSDNRGTRYRPRPVREAEALEIYSLLDHNTESGFREAFVLERDERGWYLARTTPLSP
ncbi:MAG: CapA family protein, partial [Haliea sp.]